MISNMFDMARKMAVPALVALCAASWTLPSQTFAQSVCLPAPRLLTTMPMGGKAGTQVEVTISGENIDDADQLAFSDPHITATRKLNSAGQPEPNQYVVTIAPDCPLGIHEARLMTRLGISSSRVFCVGNLPETVRTSPNTTLATAMELPVNSICNAFMSNKSVDHYSFQGKKGQRIIVDCATKGIDSKLDVVFIIADAMGRDLLVERRGGALDFTVPEDSKYVIKAHELTFNGGPAYYYRLALWELPAGEPIVRLPATRTVNACSWPPAGLPEKAATVEQEPNTLAKAQKITLPCDISGSFFPAADVDVFEFEAKKGEEWWVEVGSERFGLPTDPSILVQHVSGSGADEKLTDVAELVDIPSPVRVSSNGYAYDGPPYQAGSSDIMGEVVIQQDGLHRLQLSDLFGGTRSDPRNIYRLVIRKAAPDFALVSWALHMELRNGDRNALSKPIALRGGSTMALEVVAIRRDGFDGDIDLVMDGLPEGMRAHGLKIPKGQSRGIMLVTASQNAPRSIGSARFIGRAQINGATVEHPCPMASFSWPIPDSWGEIPNPRLLADVPVSVSGFDMAPLTVAPVSSEVHEVVAGEKLTIPLNHTRRSEFSGDTLQLRTLGAGFDQNPQFDVKISADKYDAVIDLARLKPAPGDYLIAFYGSAVAKYRHNPEAVLVAELAKKKAEEEAAAVEAEAKKLVEEAKAAATEKKAEADKAVEAVAVRQKAAAAAVAAAAEKLKQATQVAQPRDIVDIVVSEPIAIRVKPAEKN